MKTACLPSLLASIVTVLAISNAGVSGNTDSKSSSKHAAPTGVVASYAELPLFFETNKGQTDARVRFLARTQGYTLFVTPTETVLMEGRTFAEGKQSFGEAAMDLRSALPSALQMRLVGANQAPKITGFGELPGKVNYLIGNDPHAWHTGVTLYSQVRSEQVYPGVDLLFHGDQQQLEYDFVVSPGADPDRVAFRITGAERIEIDGHGDLVLHTSAMEFRMRKPDIYQATGSERRPVEGGFALKGERQVGFRVSAYDRSKPLVIDPRITYATFLGGAGNDQGGMVLDTSNPSAPKVYVRGNTSDITTFPEASTLIGMSPGAQSYVYVAKIDPTHTGASSLDYLTFIGGKVPFTGVTGPCYNSAGTISLDISTGIIEPVISAVTNCKDYPVTAGSPTTGDRDFAVTRLMPSGSTLDHSMLFGGSGTGGSSQAFFPVTAVDNAGEIILSGGTTSTNLPTTANAYATKFNNGTTGTFSDCFVAKLNRSFTILYLTYLNIGVGSTSTAVPFCGAYEDPSGQIVAAGTTLSSTAFHSAGGANGFQTTFEGKADTFLMKLNPSLSGTSQLTYSTYIGGGGTTLLDSANTGSTAGMVILVGNTTSSAAANPPDIPLLNAYQKTNVATGQKGIGWATIVDTTKTGAASLICSTYFGGSGGDDKVQAVAVDPVAGDPSAFRLVLGGQTSSANFPTMNPLQSTLVGGQNAFISVLSIPSTSAGPAASLLFSTYLGGGVQSPQQSETILGIDVDAKHTIYAVGRTLSSSYFAHTNPATNVNGFQPTCSSCSPGSVTPEDDTVVFVLPMTLQATTTAVVSSLNPSTFGHAVTFTATVKATTSGTPTGTVTFKDGTTTLSTSALSSGIAKFTTSTLAGGTHSITAVYGGNVSYAGNTSPALSQVVNKQATSTAVVSSLNPSTFGHAVTFTATAKATTSGTPTGTVTFRDGTTTLGTGALSSGIAKFTTSRLARGTHSITAVYGGNVSYAGSTSPVLKQAVQ